MSVYKEGFWIINKLLPQQRRIWDDSCDYGIPIIKGDDNWNMVKQLVEMYGEKDTREQINLDGAHKEVSIIVSLIDEWNPPHKETRYEVNYWTTGLKIKGNFDGILNITKLT